MMPGVYLVGRGAELARLDAALAGAGSGSGSAVFVAGEAGIGKTRLVTEFAERTRRGGATVLIGRCIDLIGPGMPYMAVAEALRGLPVPGVRAPGPEHPARLFEEVRAVLERLAHAGPVLVVLEDLHWADASTLDLVSFLAYAIRDLAVLLVGTFRVDDPHSNGPLGRQTGGLLRARAADLVELGPLHDDEIRILLHEAAGTALPDALTGAICRRSAGNPFFAEELFAASVRGEPALPRLLRDALLLRVAGLDSGVLQVAAAVGRDVPYRLLVATVPRPPADLLDALRAAVEHAVLVPDQSAGTFRFRHALLAEAVYSTLIPGEREELHARLAGAIAADPGLLGRVAVAGELAQHWAAADRPAEALVASIEAARHAEAVCGLAEAARYLERAIDLWHRVPGAADLTGLSRAGLLTRAAELVDLTGGGPRAAQLAREAIGLLDERAEPTRVGLLYERLGSYLLPIGDRSAGLAACERAVGLVPPAPPSVERARVLTTLGNALQLSWRHADSRLVCEEALSAAAAAHDDGPALRARGCLGVDLCYLGRPDDGLAHVAEARRRAALHGTPRDVVHGFAYHCEVLVTCGRFHEAGRVALDGLETARRLGVGRTFGALLAAYAAEALLETGDWARSDGLLDAATRDGTTFWSHYPRLLRAQLAIGRGDLDAAREHLESGVQGAREPSSAARYWRLVTELALWECRPEAALTAVDDGLREAVGVHRLRLSALGLRAAAQTAALADVRQDRRSARTMRRHADRLLCEARDATAAAAAVTPDATGWRAIAEAEHGQIDSGTTSDGWHAAMDAWDALDRPYLAAYCRWRYAQALLAGGAPEAANPPARQAHRMAVRLGARPLQRELELLAQRGRLDLAGLAGTPQPPAAHVLGLTARECEVARLLTRGYTNRQIAAELTISAKTASVHVTHIMRKLGVSSRIEAATVTHQLLGQADP
ncbi:LuxR family transcriptional regulator [Virgisporangium aurantiacum]|uniref:LuxR family transcriptional regulator n=2 Tax=Virgisporangium aurantiacum TaxID=175570 RepID=A0A8J3Z2L2_9ACTN|nr:LuxR family transcriptional regulator [Virgisporangium aurantiacum]